MVNEVLEYLRCRSLDVEEVESQKQSPVYIDGTLGTAGHTIAILKSNLKCRVVSFDRDAESMQWAKQRLEDEGLVERVALIQSDFRFAPMALEKLQEKVARGDGSTSLEAQANLENQEDDLWVESEGFLAPRVLFVGKEFRTRSGEVLLGNIAGALIDAGMSMFQVAWGERGLSFQRDAELDMRYDRSRGVSAFDLINRLSSKELEDLFFKFTDERWARRIAAIITDHRRRQVIHTTSELTSLIEAAIPAGVRRNMRVHPATKVFAALRLAVNDEFWALEHGAWSLTTTLNNAARLVILTYSSHEDRTVKRTFRRLAGRSTEPPLRQSRQERNALSKPPRASSMRSPLTQPSPVDDFSLELPSDVADLDPPDFLTDYLEGFGDSWVAKIVTGKPVEPSEDEIVRNSLARSCKLRVLEKAVVHNKRTSLSDHESSVPGC